MTFSWCFMSQVLPDIKKVRNVNFGAAMQIKKRRNLCHDNNFNFWRFFPLKSGARISSSFYFNDVNHLSVQRFPEKSLTLNDCCPFHVKTPLSYDFSFELFILVRIEYLQTRNWPGFNVAFIYVTIRWFISFKLKIRSQQLWKTGWKPRVTLCNVTVIMTEAGRSFVILRVEIGQKHPLVTWLSIKGRWWCYLLAYPHLVLVTRDCHCGPDFIFRCNLVLTHCLSFSWCRWCEVSVPTDWTNCPDDIGADDPQ